MLTWKMFLVGHRPWLDKGLRGITVGINSPGGRPCTRGGLRFNFLTKSEPRIIGFMYNPHNEWKACRRRRQGPSNPIFSSGWSCGLAVLWSGGTPPFQHPPWAAAVAKLFFSQYTWHAVKHKGDHISYLSLPPRPAVVYFFQAGVLFCKQNAKYWPIFAPYDHFRLFYADFLQA